MKDRKFLSILLLVALLLTTVINPSVSHATETVPEEAGKVFAGWYKDAQFNTPLGKNQTTDSAYAKFVDEDVLSVKLQITPGTKTTSDAVDLRLLTTVDSLMYDSVGFEITIGNKTITRTSKTVYTEITGTDGNDKLSYGPDAFSQESEAFVAYSLTDIPNDIFSSKITVKPIWITLDGTKVTGITREFSIRLYAENKVDNCTTSEQFIGSDWSSVGYNATKSSIDDGSGSVQVNCWRGWPAASMTVNDKTYDEIMEYDYISFKVYIESTTGLNAEGKKEVVFWNDTQKMYLTPGEWHHLSISTADFATYAFDNQKHAQQFKLIMIQNDESWYDANAKAYIDDIYLIDETSIATLSDFVADYGGQGGSFSYDVNVSHSDDESGSVVLSSGGREYPNVGVKLGLTAEELSKYEAITFYIKPESPAGGTEARIQIGQSAYQYPVGKWSQITIPTSQLEVNNGAVKLFNMLNSAGELTVKDLYMQVYIDDIKLIGELNGLGTSTYVAGGGSSFTYDVNVSHTADESGSVKMHSNGNAYASTSVKLGLTAEELSKYGIITFYIKPESPAGGTEARIQIGQSAYQYPVGKWSQITMQTSQLEVNNGAVKLFNMLNDAGELTVKDLHMQVYIDDIKLIGELNGLGTSTYVAGSGSSFTYDVNVSHTADESGSVKMHSNGNDYASAGVKLGLTAEEISKYEAITFYIKPESPAGGTEARIQIGQSAYQYPVGKWSQITIPTSQLGADNGGIRLFNMLNSAGELTVKDRYMQVYIDDIKLIGELNGMGTSTYVVGSGSSFTYDVNVSHTADESGSVKMHSNGNDYASAGVKLGLTAEEISKYEAITFYIKPESPAGGTEARIQIGQSAYQYPVGKWSQITIPTSQLEVNNGAVKLFNMLNSAGELTVKDLYMQVYIDDIRLVRESNGIKTSDFVADYASQGGSFSYDVNVSHTEDGSGSVKMSSDGRIWPHAAVKLGKTAEQISGYDTLSFWIMMESPSGNAQVRMYVPAIDYADNYTVGQWYKITIPTSKVTVDQNGVTDLFYMLNDTAGVGDKQAKIYIDDIILE